MLMSQFSSESSPDSFLGGDDRCAGHRPSSSSISRPDATGCKRASGYRVTSFGEEPNLGGTLMSISAESAAAALTIALHRGSTIAGVVTNDLKEPVIGAQVRAIIRRSVGDRRFMATETAKTDDRGAYRIIGLESRTVFRERDRRPERGICDERARTGDAACGRRRRRCDADGREYSDEAVSIRNDHRIADGARRGRRQACPRCSLQETGAVGFWPVTSARVDPSGQFSMNDVPVGDTR